MIREIEWGIDMEIPGELKVGGHIYTIEYPYMFTERGDVYGKTNLSRNTISITNVDGSGILCSLSNVERTFWHEVFHVIDAVYCCDKLGGSSDKESMIEGLAQGLLQVLKDNFEELKVKGDKS